MSRVCGPSADSRPGSDQDDVLLTTRMAKHDEWILDGSDAGHIEGLADEALYLCGRGGIDLAQALVDLLAQTVGRKCCLAVISGQLGDQIRGEMHTGDLGVDLLTAIAVVVRDTRSELHEVREDDLDPHR